MDNANLTLILMRAKLASLYSTERADKLFRDSMEFASEKFGYISAEMGLTVFEYASYLERSGKAAESEAFTQQYQEILIRLSIDHGIC